MNKSGKRRQTPRTEPTAAERAATAQDIEETERRRIRALLSLPMKKRTHFLRVRVGRGSAL